MAAVHSTAKTASVMFDIAKETYEHQDSMLPLINFRQPDGKDMQTSGNVIWTPKQQYRSTFSGWDATGQQSGIIEEEYPAVLGVPENDLIQQRADDKRTDIFWERAAKQSMLTQATLLNKRIAEAIVVQGGLFYRSSATSGFDFISEGQAMMDERELINESRCFILNSRNSKLFSADLAARQTLQGRPETAWKTGQIAQGVAGFDNVMTGAFLPNITGAADPEVTITGDQSFKPEGGSVNETTLVVTNVDCREAVLVVNDSSLVSVGDKFTLQNSGTDVNAVGLADKIDTTEPMIFTVIAKPTSTTITIFPKPIAPDDSSLTLLEKAYSNINTQILNGATLTRLNIDAVKKTNIFFEKSAIEVIGGTIPSDLFSQYAGMQVITDTMSNGLQLYMIYDGDMLTMNFSFRLFVWYGITIAQPENCGCAVIA